MSVSRPGSCLSCSRPSRDRQLNSNSDLFTDYSDPAGLIPQTNIRLARVLERGAPSTLVRRPGPRVVVFWVMASRVWVPTAGL